MTDKIFTSVNYLETCTTQEILKELSRRFNSWMLAVNIDGRDIGQKECCCFYGGSVAEAKGLSDLSQVVLTKALMGYVEDE